MNALLISVDSISVLDYFACPTLEADDTSQKHCNSIKTALMPIAKGAAKIIRLLYHYLKNI